MTDPFDTFGLSRDADDETIRSRYLELVRTYPPERSPQRFAEIRGAYEALRDPVYRLQAHLFDLNADYGFEEVLAVAHERRERKRFSTELLLSLGRK